MTGRKFAIYNRADPAPVVRLIPMRPACFTDPRDWRGYLLDTYRGVLDDEPGRQRLIRGEPPLYCQDCTVGYRNKMRALGLCHPPVPNQPNDPALPPSPLGPVSPASGNAGGSFLPSQEVVGEHANRLEAVARAAAKISADRRGPDVKMLPPGLAFATSQHVNAHSWFSSSPAPQAPAGLCEGVASAA